VRIARRRRARSQPNITASRQEGLSAAGGWISKL